MRRGSEAPTAHHAAVDPAQALSLFIDDLQKVIALAVALTQTSRRVDLAGLEHSVGILCAKSLDLTPDEGRAVRPALITLAATMDTLIAEMRAA